MESSLYQIGGEHYNPKPGITQHKDYCAAINAPYFEGCASKYVTRWTKKDGIKDLKKAQHYIQFRLEAYEQGCFPRFGRWWEKDLFDKFIQDNDVPELEARIIDLILHWTGTNDLYNAIGLIDELIASEPDGSYVNQD